MGKTAEIAHDGEKVTITVQCGEIYEAMQLYDELVMALGDGMLMLTVETPRARQIRMREGQ